ncbi:MAG: rubredoxin [Hyphomicrobiales bacterium]|nr:rubredoxin [Hyphomicrobiales bacterium]
MLRLSFDRRTVLAALFGIFATGSGVANGRAGRRAPVSDLVLKRLQKWECTNEECEPYVYDPSTGDVNVSDLDDPIPPGTAFDNLPDDWVCPICNDPKRDFEPTDEWVEVWVRARSAFDTPPDCRQGR